MRNKYNIMIPGDKVILRTVEEQDREMLQSLILDSEFKKVTKGYAGPAFFMNRSGWLDALSDREDSFPRIIAKRERPETGLGMIVLSHMDVINGTAEIYIKLAKSVRGSGYGKDAVNTLSAYAFDELRLGCVYSNILETNVASQRLFEACGFEQERIHSGRADRDGVCRKIYTYRKSYKSAVSTPSMMI